MYIVLCKCIFGTFCCCTLKLEPTSRIQNHCTQFASWILFSTPGLTLKHIKPSTLRNQSGWSRNNNRNELPATPKPVTQLAFSTRQSQPSSTNNVSVNCCCYCLWLLSFLSTCCILDTVEVEGSVRAPGLVLVILFQYPIFNYHINIYYCILYLTYIYDFKIRSLEPVQLSSLNLLL